jgi:hypothetical protein
MFERPLIDEYAFVMIGTRQLASTRLFWTQQLGCAVMDEQSGWFAIDAGGLRLRIDFQDGSERSAREPDPVIGLKVHSVAIALSSLAARGLQETPEISTGPNGRYAIIHDPDGHAIVLIER